MSGLFCFYLILRNGIVIYSLIIKARSEVDRLKYICDSYITIDETEIFLCRTISDTLIWVSRSDIPAAMLEIFLPVAYNKLHDGIKPPCNNDKTRVFSCLLKCKTIGILIAATNCGMIIGSRELYGSESPTQAAAFYLDLCDYYVGKLFTLILYWFLVCFIKLQ